MCQKELWGAIPVPKETLCPHIWANHLECMGRVCGGTRKRNKESCESLKMHKNTPRINGNITPHRNPKRPTTFFSDYTATPLHGLLITHDAAKLGIIKVF